MTPGLAEFFGLSSLKDCSNIPLAIHLFPGTGGRRHRVEIVQV